MNSKSIILLLVLVIHGICAMQLSEYTNVITSCEPTQTATVYPSKREPSPSEQENLAMTSCETTVTATVYPSKSQLSFSEQETPMQESLMKVLGFELLYYAFKL